MIISISLLLIRLQLASIFIPFGWQKLMAGQPKWLWLGMQMQNFGIYFWPVGWGLAAACAEFFGGISILLGLGTRAGAFFIACVMIVALVMHITNKDPFWSVWVKPLALLVLALVLIMVGGGRYSLDHYLAQKMNTRTMEHQ
jgi:putative oxidoreductase